MHQRKNFIPRNEGFSCEACGQVIPPARGTFRNHCPHCLTSKHVDEHTPGDRLATCGGLMPPVGIEGVNPDTMRIAHKCQSCGKRNRNIMASDDDRDQAFSILENT